MMIVLECANRWLPRTATLATLQDWYARNPTLQYLAKPLVASISWLLFGNLFTVKWHFLVALLTRSTFLSVRRTLHDLRRGFRELRLR